MQRTTTITLGILLLCGTTNAQTLAQCENIVGIHRMMLDIKDECRLRLRKDTSDLAYQCITRFSDAQSTTIINNSRSIQAAIRKEHGKNFCPFVRKEFSTLLR